MSKVNQEVTFQELLELYVRDAMIKTNCHALGEITKFDKDTQLCEVKISYGRRFAIAQKDGTSKDEVKDYPLLVDVPLIQMSGGEGGLALPISVGDSCLLLFNDRDLDNWFSGKSEGFVRTKRIHSLSDALALVGPRNSKDASARYEDGKTVLYLGTTKITLGTKVVIENDLHNLKNLMVELITTVKAITTQGSATNQAVDAASIAALELVSIKFQGLLE